MTASPMRRPGGRSARVRSQVMAATIDVLAKSGVAGLSVEAVAARAGVNKSTIYRRWPTLADLVTEAIGDLQQARIPLPDTGALASDLRALLAQARALLTSADGRALAHAALGTPASAAAARASRKVWAARFALLGRVVQRGVERGELPPDVDARFLLETLVSPLYFRLFVAREPVDDAYLDRLVEQALRAARPRPARRRGGRR
ncbi:MAG: TetR/AcrR family transcriptional regulator [Myxococcota bacterium]